MKGRLVLRVFLYGFALLVVSAAAFLGLQAFLIGPPDHNGPRIFPVLTRAACAELAKPRPDFSIYPTLTLYRDDGTMLATSVQPPFHPVARERLDELRARGSIQTFEGPGAFACEGSSPFAYAVFARPPRQLPLRHVAFFVVVVVLAAALGSIPFARSIARPLEEIVKVTRAFGEGALSVRAAQTRDDIGDLARSFNEMAERLEGLIRAEKEMLANISHELRTPLARIRVVLDVAEQNPQRAQALLGEIARDLADLERLVEDVLAAVRLEVGAVALTQHTLPIRLEPTDVASLLHAAVDHFHDASPDRAVELEAPADLPRALGDARLLRRVVDNLLDNAHKYSDPTAPIVVRASKQGDFVRVSVADEGPGIGPEDLEKLGTPFYRADKSRSRDTGGVGLGLALARRIVEAHHGNLDLKSEVGVGTTVSFALATVEEDESAPVGVRAG